MSEANSTLILLTPGFPENEEDTTCLPFAQTYIIALKESYPDLEIIIIAFQYPFFRNSYSWKNNEVICMGGAGKGEGHRLVLWFRVWRTLMKLNKEKNVIGLFSLWCTECSLTGHYFSKFYKLKHYIWLCGQDAKSGNKYVRYIRPKEDELVAMSDFLKMEFYRNFSISPKHVIPLCLDIKQFSGKPAARDIDILGVGSLIPLKQYDVFINVIKKLTEHLPLINTIICGKGPEENSLKTLIATAKLDGNIFLAGEVAHPHVLTLMQRTKIFLHTSNYEGFGLVCLEALYAGAHVISFTKPMDHQILHWHHVNNEGEMFEKLYEILTTPETDYQSVQPFASSDLAHAMMELYGCLLLS